MLSDTIMALKRRRFGQLNELDKKTKVTRDIEHLRKLRGHSNIITLYGYFEMCGEAFICMEKMETCFAKILQICVKKDILIPTKVLATLCYSISSALVFLKEKKIIHRDVKPGQLELCVVMLTCCSLLQIDVSALNTCINLSLPF